MTTFDAKERAQIEAGGLTVEDFETVWVKLYDGEAWPEFRFTMAERDAPGTWEKVQLVPGLPCVITLGGQRAITGTIISRQVAYDATTHATQLYGKGGTFWATKSSAKTKTGNFDNKTFRQIVEEVFHGGYVKYKVGIIHKGREFLEPLHQIQIQQGESNWDFLERVARPIGAIMSSDKDGNIVVIWPRTMENAGALMEGVNILKCNFVVSEDTTNMEYLVTAQSDASSGNTGKDAQEIISDPVKGTQRQPSLNVTMAEGPLKGKPQATFRAANEMRWGEAARVHAQVTVQGWINPGTGQLWLPGQIVTLASPMCPFNGSLGIKSVTFTQDSRSGTLTMLELVQPEYLNGGGTGGGGWSPGDPAINHAVPPTLDNKMITPEPTEPAGGTGGGVQT